MSQNQTLFLKIYQKKKGLSGMFSGLALNLYIVPSVSKVQFKSLRGTLRASPPDRAWGMPMSKMGHPGFLGGGTGIY